jgi:2'-5' RNA ligase
LPLPRLFIAIELPAEVRQELASIQQRLAGRAPGFRWVAASRMHLTLLFLGETPEVRLDDVRLAMDAAAVGMTPLYLALGPVGSFGRPAAARVIWLAVQAPPALFAIRQRLAEGCQARGLAADFRPFTPHLTLGRARPENGPRRPAHFADGLVPAACPFTARELVLFESREGAGGSTYSDRHRVALGK